MSALADDVYTALFGLEEVREILRESAPGHELDEKSRARALKKLGKIRKALDRLEAGL